LKEEVAFPSAKTKGALHGTYPDYFKESRESSINPKNPEKYCTPIRILREGGGETDQEEGSIDEPGNKEKPRKKKRTNGLGTKSKNSAHREPRERRREG